MGVRFSFGKFLLVSSALVLLYIIQLGTAIPTEKIRQHDRKLFENSEKRGDGREREGRLVEVNHLKNDRTIQIDSILSPISSLLDSLTSKLGGITNSTKGGLENLTDLFMKPSLGTGGGCDTLDPLLLANIPGIFFLVPLVILGVSILVGVVAAIAIAIGGLGSTITESILDKIKEKMNQGGYSESSSYGVPSSSYGSPSSSYSRLSETVDQLTDNFSQAYDKYSALSHQPQQQTPFQIQQQQQIKDYYENQSQYDKWNQVARARQG